MQNSCANGTTNNDNNANRGAVYFERPMRACACIECEILNEQSERNLY